MHNKDRGAMAGTQGICLGGGISSPGPKTVEREPVAIEILRIAEDLHKRACVLSDRMAGKLAPVARDIEPVGMCGTEAQIERTFPPLFEQLRQDFRMINLYLGHMEYTLDRVEL